MNPIMRNVLAVVVGFIFGSVVNLGFINLGMSVIPAPPGADTSTMEGLKLAMALFEPKHFLFPFLAHAFGTLAGAAAAARLGVSHHLKLAMGVGVLFLCGGLNMIVQIPSPMWFNAVDLIFAYLPMAWIGAKLAATRIKSETDRVGS
jgi:hypothetical protein